MLNIDQEKYRFWGKYRYPISNIGMKHIDMKYRYIKRKISIFSIFRYRYCITSMHQPVFHDSNLTPLWCISTSVCLTGADRKYIRLKETDSVKLDNKKTYVFFALMYFLFARVRQTSPVRLKTKWRFLSDYSFYVRSFLTRVALHAEHSTKG